MACIRKIKLKSGTAHELVYYLHAVQYRKYYGPQIPYYEVKREALRIEHDKAYAKAGLAQPAAALTISGLQREYADKRKNEVDTWREILSLEILKRHLGDMPLGRITIDHLHRFRDLLLTERRQPDIDKRRRGVNKELKQLRVAFNWAFKRGYLKEQIFKRIEFYKVSQPQMQILSRSETRRIYAHLPRNRMRLAYVLLKYEGLRRGEVVQIAKADIDLQRKIITLKRTKNMQQNVKLPVHPKLARILKWIRLSDWQDGLIVPYQPSSISKAFRLAMIKAGCRKVSPVHILRHTFVTRILQDSKNIFLAQKLARHANISTTRIYEHLDIEDIRADFERIKL